MLIQSDGALAGFVVVDLVDWTRRVGGPGKAFG